MALPPQPWSCGCSMFGCELPIGVEHLHIKIGLDIFLDINVLWFEFRQILFLLLELSGDGLVSMQIVMMSFDNFGVVSFDVDL